ncbi:hypothetical protein [Celeribacter marinus]|uniref:lysozyme inhibitor LprI family protein n=1 Tax=Celeribacter marinus TaxID=1397108 RepID=UPI003181B02A
MLQYIRSLCLALLLSAGIGSVAKAASFDCNKATTETEIAICSDPELSALDELTAEAYALAKAANASPHCKQSRMELFAFLCGDQAKELLLADQKRWLNNRNITQTSGELFDKMYRRTIELSSGAIGQNFQKILQLLSRLDSLPDEHLGMVNTKFIKLDVFHNRVITFETLRKGSSTYLFDMNGNLARVFLSEEFTEDACESVHSIYDRASGSKYDKFRASVSCHNYDRSSFTSDFILTSDCIELFAASSSDRWIDEQWELNAGDRRCAEHDNFDILFPSVEGLSSNINYFESIGGFVDFVKNYWANSPVKAVGDDFEGCGASTEQLTEIKLINLYKLLSTSGEYYVDDDINFIRAPSSFSFLGYSEPGQSSYANMVSFYEKYKSTFDPFLPFAKVLDTDSGIKNYVSSMLEDYEKGVPSRLDGYYDCETFKVTQGDFFRYTYFRKSGFWKRRELDGTTDQTVELLGKLQKIFAD